MEDNLKEIINQCDTDPSAIFPMINRGEFGKVKYLIDNNIVSVNTVDMNNNDVVVRLLKVGEYSLVLDCIKKKNWDINHQNNDGDTFGHILATYSNSSCIKIFDALISKKNFVPNIRNKKGETMFDKSTNNNSLIASLKILGDKRFTSIDLYDFKKLFNLGIDNNYYGSYSKLSNFNTIFNSLNKKNLQPNMRLLIDRIKDNKDAIKCEIMNNNVDIIKNIVYTTINEIS